MGTRSITYVYSERDVPIIAMYRQYDGDYEGHGKELADFLTPFRVVNGIRAEDRTGAVANGMECLAAQLVAHFKKGIGGIYLQPPGDGSNTEEYTYHVRLQDGGLHLKVHDYDGPIRDFNAWAAAHQDEE